MRGMSSGGQGSGQLGVGAAEASGDDKEGTSKLSQTGGQGSWGIYSLTPYLDVSKGCFQGINSPGLPCVEEDKLARLLPQTEDPILQSTPKLNVVHMQQTFY